MMRPSWSLLLFLLLVPLLLHAARASSGADAAAAVGGVEAEQREHKHGGGHEHHAAPAMEGDAFYLQVGRFAVMVHSMWHGIKPVPKLERVVSASMRPAGGGGVDYLLVLRVAPPLGTCRVLVWGVPGEGSQDWKLKYFEPVAGA
ncbi:unnamed protein product [Urochloa humidicola]